MPLLGAIHLSLMAAIVAVSALLAFLCRGKTAFRRPVRFAIGAGLALNELVWWIFRYSHEGVHRGNLPLQLSDVTVWTTLFSCFKIIPTVLEFSYFAGLLGASMAILTPDLWAPWPSYPSIYFFAAHGGVVVAIAVLVFGGAARLRPGAVWRSFALLLCYTAVVGAFDAVSGANYMYLRHKPRHPSALDAFGPWPYYILTSLPVALGLFWLLWVAARPASRRIV